MKLFKKLGIISLALTTLVGVASCDIESLNKNGGRIGSHLTSSCVSIDNLYLAFILVLMNLKLEIIFKFNFDINLPKIALPLDTWLEC